MKVRTNLEALKDKILIFLKSDTKFFSEYRRNILMEELALNQKETDSLCEVIAKGCQEKHNSTLAETWYQEGMLAGNFDCFLKLGECIEKKNRQDAIEFYIHNYFECDYDNNRLLILERLRILKAEKELAEISKKDPLNALHFQVRLNNLTEVTRLIHEHKNLVNQTSKNGLTALHYAATISTEMVDILIKQGQANCNQEVTDRTHEFKLVPLTYAFKYNQNESCFSILDYLKPLTQLDDDIAVYWAIAFKRVDIIKWYVDHFKVDVRKKNQHGLQMVDYAQSENVKKYFHDELKLVSTLKDFSEEAINAKYSNFSYELRTSAPPRCFVNSASYQQKKLLGGASAYGQVHLFESSGEQEKYVVKRLKCRTTEQDLAKEAYANLLINGFGSYHLASDTLLDVFFDGDTINKIDLTPFAPAQIITLQRQLIADLEKMQQNHIIHDDLHSGNVLLRYQEEKFATRLIDFGCCNKNGIPNYRPYKYRAHLAPELQNVPMPGRHISQNIYSLGHIFKSHFPSFVHFSFVKKMKAIEPSHRPQLAELKKRFSSLMEAKSKSLPQQATENSLLLTDAIKLYQEGLSLIAENKLFSEQEQNGRLKLLAAHKKFNVLRFNHSQPLKVQANYYHAIISHLLYAPREKLEAHTLPKWLKLNILEFKEENGHFINIALNSSVVTVQHLFFHTKRVAEASFELSSHPLSHALSEPIPKYRATKTIDTKLSF